MPRTRRWNAVQSSFKSGQLSPAVQDDITSAEWGSGLADCLNYQIERDGGMKPRPRFWRRREMGVPVPHLGLLAGQRWSVDDYYKDHPLADGEGSVDPQGQETTGGDIPETLYDRIEQRGIARVDVRVKVPASPDQSKPILRVPLAEGAPSSFTFHEVRLQGDESRWFTTIGGEQYLNLEVWAQPRGESIRSVAMARPFTMAEMELEPHERPDPLRNPFFWGAFAPGAVLRDIVVPLRGTGEEDIEEIQLRPARNDTSAFRIAIGGVSCFASEEVAPRTPDAMPPKRLRPELLDAPVRLIPWVQRGEAYVVALGMDFLGWANTRDTDRGWLSQARTHSFTRRQLGELTWTPYGGELLLCHRDFPHPLRLFLEPENEVAELQIETLRVRNVPLLPDFVRIPQQVGESGRIIAIEGGGTGGLPSTPVGLMLEAQAGGRIRASWTPANAQSYQLEWGTKADADANRMLRTETFSSTRADRTVSGTPGVEYSFRVQSVNSVGNSAWSPFVSIYARHQALATPALTATAKAASDPTTTPADLGRVSLTWTYTGGNTTGFRLERRLSGEGEDDWTEAALYGATVRSGVLELEPGREYELRIRANGAEHYPDSAWSAIAQVAVPDWRLDPPQALVPRGVSSAYIHVGWGPVSGAQGYRLEYRRFGDEPWITLQYNGSDRLTGLPLSDQYVMHPDGADGYPPVPLVTLTTYQLRVATYYRLGGGAYGFGEYTTILEVTTF